MKLDTQHVEILQDIGSFSGVERYRGMLPAKLALCYDQRKINELVQADLVERIEMTYACGQEATLLKLTEGAEELLEYMSQNGTQQVVLQRKRKEPVYSPAPECADLSEIKLQIMRDLYHFSNIRRFGGIMPSEEAEGYPPRELNELFAMGFIIRVKAEIGTGEKRKGYILSDKGLRCLGRM